MKRGGSIVCFSPPSGGPQTAPANRGLYFSSVAGDGEGPPVFRHLAICGRGRGLPGKWLLPHDPGRVLLLDCSEKPARRFASLPQYLPSPRHRIARGGRTVEEHDCVPLPPLVVRGWTGRCEGCRTNQSVSQISTRARMACSKPRSASSKGSSLSIRRPNRA